VFRFALIDLHLKGIVTLAVPRCSIAPSIIRNRLASSRFLPTSRVSRPSLSVLKVAYTILPYTWLCLTGRPLLFRVHLGRQHPLFSYIALQQRAATSSTERRLKSVKEVLQPRQPSQAVTLQDRPTDKRLYREVLRMAHPSKEHLLANYIMVRPMRTALGLVRRSSH
jgi:hypothetical protein